MPYQPFIDDPSHIKALDRQRFVVLRAPPTVSTAYHQVQELFRDRLHGQPVSYPARGHVTLCGFAAGTPLPVVQELVRSWTMAVPPLRIEVVRVSSFPSPFQVVIVEVRKTQGLFSALADLRDRAEHEASMEAESTRAASMRLEQTRPRPRVIGAGPSNPPMQPTSGAESPWRSLKYGCAARG